jgi:DNA-binding MarR family transcriptional regulator
MASGITPRGVALTERRTVVAQLYVRRCTQVEIAKKLNVNQSTISRDIAAVQKEWLANRLHDLDRHKAEALASIDAREREAWAEWERSKADRSSVTTTEGGEDEKTVRRSESACGDPRYLQVLEGCVEQRARILGLFIVPREFGLGEDAVREQRYLALADRVLARLMEGEFSPVVPLPAIEVNTIIKAQALLGESADEERQRG